MAWLLELKAQMKEREILCREAFEAADEDRWMVRGWEMVDGLLHKWRP